MPELLRDIASRIRAFVVNRRYATRYGYAPGGSEERLGGSVQAAILVRFLAQRRQSTFKDVPLRRGKPAGGGSLQQEV